MNIKRRVEKLGEAVAETLSTRDVLAMVVTSLNFGAAEENNA
jgi:hypothetical protein